MAQSGSVAALRATDQQFSGMTSTPGGWRSACLRRPVPRPLAFACARSEPSRRTGLPTPRWRYSHRGNNAADLLPCKCHRQASHRRSRTLSRSSVPGRAGQGDHKHSGRQHTVRQGRLVPPRVTRHSGSDEGTGGEFAGSQSISAARSWQKPPCSAAPPTLRPGGP